VRVDAIIFWSGDVERTVAFYRALGLPIETEDHGDGHVHHACDVDGVHVAFFAAGDGSTRAPRRGEHGAGQPSFRVTSLDAAVASLEAIGELRVLIDRQPGPWGTRVVVEDPDGRPLQLTEP
jgi:catechol 2,3-dioxygenase-like lactoylglutathione lyase family enzyme